MNSTKVCMCSAGVKPTPGDHRVVTEENSSWLPSKESEQKTVNPCNMGEIKPPGVWATGAVNWSPEGGLTGVRPVVDHYSTSRFSDAEWKKHNDEIITIATKDIHKMNLAEFNSRRGIQCISLSVDNNQHTSTTKIGHSFQNLVRWKNEVDKTLEAISEEVDLLERERRRAGQSRAVLDLATTISNECLSRRAMRQGFELTRDEVEEELIKEKAMIKEIEDLITKTINQIEDQQARNKNTKEQLEKHWSDKQEAFHLMKKSFELTTNSQDVMFKPAATRFSENQLSEQSWERETINIIGVTEAVRAQSLDLRHMLHGTILTDSVNDLRKQADKVDVALAKKISSTDQCVKTLVRELDVVVRRNAETENLVLDLQVAVRSLDKAMKVAQMRLYNMQKRPNIENCRDKAQIGLIEEVANLGEQSTAMRQLLQEAQDRLSTLVKSRGIIEKEIQNKLKSLYIDKDRCQIMRAQYPPASKLAGH